MKPVVERLRKEGLPIWEVDVDEHLELATRFKVSAIPTFLVLKNGEEAERRVGMISEKELREMAPPTNTKDNSKSKSKSNTGLDDTASTARVAALLLAQSKDDALVQYCAEASLRAERAQLAGPIKRIAEGKYPALLRDAATRGLALISKENERAKKGE